MALGPIFRACEFEPLIVGQSVAVVILTDPDDAWLRLIAEGIAFNTEVVVATRVCHAVVEASNEITALSTEADGPATREMSKDAVARLLVRAIVGVGVAYDDVAVDLMSRGWHILVDAVDHGFARTGAPIGIGWRTDMDAEVLCGGGVSSLKSEREKVCALG